MSHTFVPNGTVYDDFRDLTIGTTINTRTSDSGHTWGSRHRTETWQIQDGTHFGGPDEGEVAGTSGDTYNMLGIDFGSADADVLITIERPIDLALRAGLMLRRTADLNSCYTVTLFGSTVQVDKVTGITNPFLDPVETTIATWTGLTFGEMSVLRAIMSGNDIDAYINGAFVGSVTDSTYTGTIHGMFQRFGGTTTSYRFYAFNMSPLDVGWTVDAMLFGNTDGWRIGSKIL